MSDSAFAGGEFFLLILLSIVLPVSVYLYMIRRRTLPRPTVPLHGAALVAKSAVAVLPLERLAGTVLASLQTAMRLRCCRT